MRAPWRFPAESIATIVESRRAWIEKHLAFAIPQLPPFTDSELKQLVLKAKEYIPYRVKHYAHIMGISYGAVTIRKQRTRWGSCSSKGNLNFNCLLMLTPPQVIDSVVVHELCHRRHMDHSPLFYAELLKFYPDYHRWNAWLKTNGAQLLARLGGS